MLMHQIAQKNDILGIKYMKKLIEMPYKDGNVIVAVEVPVEAAHDEIRNVSRKSYFDDLTSPHKVEQDFGVIADMIFKCCKPIIESFERLGTERTPPKRATVEFGLSFNYKGNIYVVTTSMEGSINISFEWEFERQSQ
jgi:hypothetical protein